MLTVPLSTFPVLYSLSNVSSCSSAPKTVHLRYLHLYLSISLSLSLYPCRYLISHYVPYLPSLAYIRCSNVPPLPLPSSPSLLELPSLAPASPLQLIFLSLHLPAPLSFRSLPCIPSYTTFDFSFLASPSLQVPFKRAVFHEITKDAILKSFENPREIDMNIVQSQETRRCYSSPFLSFPSSH
jgi:hypothetical protein